MLKIIFFGDVFGRPGREALEAFIPEVKKKYDPDLIIANGENMAHGSGVTKKTFEQCVDAGVDFFTSGNHIFSKKEAIELLEEKNPKIVRPANYPAGTPGNGYQIVQIRTKKIAVVNLMGRVFFREDLDDPFRKIDEILEEVGKETNNIFVDFHTEVTSEIVAMKYYLDGRVSALVGTHTHVPTQDFHVTKKGTFFVSDSGMVGPKDSILGVDPDIIIQKYLTQIPVRHEVAESDEAEVNAIYLEIENDGKISSFEKIYEFISL